MLLGALNNVLPEEFTSREGKIHCTLVVAGGSPFGRVAAPVLGAGNQQSSQTQFDSLTSLHSPALVAAQSDLA